MTERERPAIDRRTLLSSLAGGLLASTAGCGAFTSGTDRPVSTVEPARARSLAERFAPSLYFDEHERWYPTDPQPYERSRDGETVVDGFDALDGYVSRGGATDPPDPTVFYRVLEYDSSPLTVVQFWLYSVFDQFTTNFHRHDWELLQVFIDSETEAPQLTVASSHSRSVPNNEFLDPQRARARILSELGSHSSGLSVNEAADSFQRLPLDGTVADITNSVIDGIDAVAEIPLAYGLPRDEGLAVPYALPELNGRPLYESERLSSVSADDLLPDALVVESFDEVTSPPELPARSSGRRFEYAGAMTEAADVAYELQPTTALDDIAAFTGPQLSFQFAVPKFAEDAVERHITTATAPWEDPRYTDPASDITEPEHRAALAERYAAIGEPAPVNQVIAAVTEAVPEADAPDGAGVTTTQPSLEVFALLESEAEAVPTFRGIAAVQGVPPGEHRLTINGAGIAPHAEPVPVAAEERTTAAGVDGEIPVVAREQAVKVAIDPRAAKTELTDFAVADDFAGRLYEASLSGPDAVYVHAGGAYTAEVKDRADEIGAFRVNPATEDRIPIDDPGTGTAPLATYVADVARETSEDVRATAGTSGDSTTSRGGGDNAVDGLATALEAVATAARSAAQAAANGNPGQAQTRLDTVGDRLERVAARLAAARESLPEALARATETRLAQARRRTEQAKAATTL